MSSNCQSTAAHPDASAERTLSPLKRPVRKSAACRVTTLPLQSTTQCPASRFKALLSRMARVLVVPEFSHTPCASWSWSPLLPSSPAPWLPIDGLLQRFLLQLDRPLIQVSRSPFTAAAGVSSHHPLLEFFFEILFFGLKLGSLMKNSHASFFLILKRCFSSTRVLQNSRFRRSSCGLLRTSCCLIEASSLPVASTKRLNVSSSIAAWSWARVVDLDRAPRTLPGKAKGL